MELQDFDFNSEEFKRHSTKKQLWLYDHYKKPMTEEEFIIEWKNLHNFLHGKKRRHLSPSSCRKKYQHLVKKFDFFGTLSK